MQRAPKGPPDSGYPPLHLIFPAPIPEPPRVIQPGLPIPDISISSDYPTKRKQIKNYNNNPVTTTIHPTDRVLRQLRRKYGILNSDDDDDSLGSFDSNYNSFEWNSKHNHCENGGRKFDRDRLERVQGDIRNQLRRLELNDNVDSNSDLVLVPETVKSTQVLIDQIRRQERQLERISNQIEVLMEMHRASSRQYHFEEDHPSPEDYFEVQIENTKSRAKFGHSSHAKIVKSQTSSPKKSNSSNLPKNTDYLDTSIENLRGELWRNTSLTDDQTYPKHLDHSNLTNSSSRSGSMEDPKQYYGIMLENINSILERNRSSDLSSRNSSQTSTSSCQNSNASSNSPLCGSDVKMMTKTTTTTTIEQTPTRVRRMLHSEQSLYIQKLASKYHIEEGVDKYKQSAKKTPRKPLDLNPKTPTYALSEHNNSIATRNYLDKYGLTLEGVFNRKCSKILEENEEAFQNDSDCYLDAEDKTPQKKVQVREIKSRTAQKRQTQDSKIIDLEALRRLPKFT